MPDYFTGLLPYCFGEPFEEIQIYDDLYYIPSVSYCINQEDKGFFPIAYGSPGGLPEEPDFTPERIVDICNRFNNAEHSNGMPEPITVDVAHAGAKGGYPQNIKSWIVQMKYRPFNDMVLYDVNKQIGNYNKLAQGSLMLLAKAAFPLWQMSWLHDEGAKASVALFQLPDKPWIIRNVGLCQVQNLRGLPIWAIDRVGLEKTMEKLQVKETMSYLLDELKEKGQQIQDLNAATKFRLFQDYRLKQLKKLKEETLEPTKMKTNNADNQGNEKTKVNMTQSIRDSLKSALVTCTGDQFTDACEAFIVAIEATADANEDPALADAAGNALIAKLGGTSSENSGENKISDLVAKAVKEQVGQAVQDAVAQILNSAKPAEGKTETTVNSANVKLYDAIINMVKTASEQVKTNDAGKPNIGSQVNAPDKKIDLNNIPASAFMRGGK